MRSAPATAAPPNIQRSGEGYLCRGARAVSDFSLAGTVFFTFTCCGRVLKSVALSFPAISLTEISPFAALAWRSLCWALEAYGVYGGMSARSLRSGVNLRVADGGGFRPSRRGCLPRGCRSCSLHPRSRSLLPRHPVPSPGHRDRPLICHPRMRPYP